MKEVADHHQPRIEVHPLLKITVLGPSGAREMLGGAVPEAPHVTRVISAYSSAYVLPAAEGAADYIVIDAGMDTEARNIRATLAELGAAAVGAIFITHGHLDHVKGVNSLGAADIYVSDHDEPYLLGHKRAEGFIGTLAGKLPQKARPDRERVKLVGNGQEVMVGEKTVRAYHLPGHTSGSMAYVVDGVLFVGDALYFKQNGQAGLSPAPLNWDSQVAASSLGVLLEQLDRDGIEISAVVPSHSGAGTLDAVRVLADSDQRG
jgi:glyoxylase-like metal-dependent hydrolase (beta-lactamase superfamily II)